MSLGDIVSRDRTEPVLSVEADLEKFLRSASDLETGGAGEQEVGWHPSKLFDMCPRFEVLRQISPDQYVQRVAGSNKLLPRTRIIFNVGTALHEWWQEQYFGPMGVLKGTWRCAKCGFKVADSTMPMTTCGCGPARPIVPIPGLNRFWKFDEVAVRNREWGIVGHSDGIYILAKGSDVETEAVLEIKTAGPSFWKDVRPYPSNIFQMNLYMWLLGKQCGVLLYVDKGGISGRPVLCKEIILEYDDKYRVESCEKIEAYREAARTRTLPPRLAICELTPTAPKPRSCPLGECCLSDRTAATIEKEWGAVALL